VQRARAPVVTAAPQPVPVVAVTAPLSASD
jgi:hypothetical protein